VINLLDETQDDLVLFHIFITHDLSFGCHISDCVVVIHRQVRRDRRLDICLRATHTNTEASKS
jgi:ABC-type oligopeptide transport system ATPase subunit